MVDLARLQAELNRATPARNRSCHRCGATAAGMERYEGKWRCVSERGCKRRRQQLRHSQTPG